MKEPLDYDLLEKPDSNKLIFFVVVLSICESIHLLTNGVSVINLYKDIDLEILSLFFTVISQIILSAAWFVISRVDPKYKKVLIFHISASVLFLIFYLFLI